MIFLIKKRVNTQRVYIIKIMDETIQKSTRAENGGQYLYILYKHFTILYVLCNIITSTSISLYLLTKYQHTYTLHMYSSRSFVVLQSLHTFNNFNKLCTLLFTSFLHSLHSTMSFKLHRILDLSWIEKKRIYYKELYKE